MGNGYCKSIAMYVIYHAFLCTNLCTISGRSSLFVSGLCHQMCTNVFRVYVFASFSPEVTWGGAEAALDAGHALHLAMGHIVVELGIRGARGIVADAGKLAHADVVVCLEVLVERIGQLGGCEGLAHLALHLKLYICKAVEQVFVGAEADAADAHILARG